jgi:uncharacterized SAM-dependent methyltransferase
VENDEILLIMTRVFAFDVDETLDISNGPIGVKVIELLYNAGHIVGICGNFPQFIREVPNWNKMVSFIGQFYPLLTKDQFLTQIKTYVQADEYIMIGNDPAHYGNSNDIDAALKAGWTFVREDKFRLEDWI